MNSNKNIANSLLEKIIDSQSRTLPLEKLENYINASLPALDSTFPKDLRELIDKLPATIQKKQTENFAAVLNSPNEFICNENEGVDELYSIVIISLKKFLS